ncbi:MAG: alpha/beta hydrolase [Gammaproteobacteria bacterium]|nr:alpha/beta hydrolase [Gammaproteobacteria bacterium]
MLFITNRTPQGSIETTLNRAYQFDLNINAPANSAFYCQRYGHDDYREIGSVALMNALKKSAAKQLLFYIHGSACMPEPDVFERAQLLQQSFNQYKEGMVEVIPLIWPCDNDFGMIKDYWDDQKSADLSGYSFARVLQKFIHWRHLATDEAPCLKRINVLAHSMGNRVLRETLSTWDHYDLANGVPLLFRNTFMVAADVVNEALEKQQSGRLISESSRNVSVYYAADDLALQASKISNLKNRVASRRLGHTGPEDMAKVQANVFAIDCDNVNSQYDWPIGHSYFVADDDANAGAVFEHICQSIDTGRVVVNDAANRRHQL